MFPWQHWTHWCCATLNGLGFSSMWLPLKSNSQPVLPLWATSSLMSSRRNWKSSTSPCRILLAHTLEGYQVRESRILSISLSGQISGVHNVCVYSMECTVPMLPHSKKALVKIRLGFLRGDICMCGFGVPQSGFLLKTCLIGWLMTEKWQSV